MNILDKFKNFRPKNIIIFILANYLTVCPELTYMIMVLGFGVGLAGLNDDSSSKQFFCIGLSILVILTLILVIIKIIVLPIAYHYIEKHDDYTGVEINIVKFIHNLKSSWKWKIGVIIAITIIPTALTNDEPAFLVFLLFLSPLPSYLALFLWWWIEDLIKKRKITSN